MAASKLLHNLDVNKNELQNVRVQNLGTAPGSPAEGQIYYDTTLDSLRVYNGVSWDSMGDAEGSVLDTDFNAHTIMKADVDDTPLPLTVGPATFVGRKSTGNIVALTQEEARETAEVPRLYVHATSDPTVSNTRAGGYPAGAIWINVAGSKAWMSVGDGSGSSGSVTVQWRQIAGPGLDGSVDPSMTEAVQDILGSSISGSNGINAVYNDAAGVVNFTADTEWFQDLVGAMVTGNTETGITVTYDDATGTLDFVVGALNTLPAPTGNLSLNNQRITNLAGPAADTDAATKGYVDATAQGLAVKAPVRAVQDGAITRSGVAHTVDGISLSTGGIGSRLLLINQASAADNGIWVVASGAWTRPTDYDTAAEVAEGSFVFVEDGVSREATGWVLREVEGTYPTLTTQDWVQFSGAGTYTAGAGLSLTGGDFAVNVDNSTIEINSDTLRVKDLGVTTAKIANDAVTNAKFRDSAALSVVGRAVNSVGDVADIAAGTAGHIFQRSGTTLVFAPLDLTNSASRSGLLPVGAGGTGASSVAGARNNLGFLTGFAASWTGAGITLNVDHNLNTKDVLVQVWDNATGEQLEPEIVRSTVNRVILNATTAPGAATWRVMIAAMPA